MKNNFVTNAPNMFQNMVAPDLAAQQVQLDRNQQLAALLRKQALEPDGGTEMVSGRAVPKSPLIALSKVLQAGLGAYMQNEADTKSLELGKNYQQRATDFINNIFPDEQGSQTAITSPDSQISQPWINSLLSGAPGPGPMISNLPPEMQQDGGVMPPGLANDQPPAMQPPTQDAGMISNAGGSASRPLDTNQQQPNQTQGQPATTQPATGLRADLEQAFSDVVGGQQQQPVQSQQPETPLRATIADAFAQTMAAKAPPSVEVQSGMQPKNGQAGSSFAQQTLSQLMKNDGAAPSNDVLLGDVTQKKSSAIPSASPDVARSTAQADQPSQAQAKAAPPSLKRAATIAYLSGNTDLANKFIQMSWAKYEPNALTKFMAQANIDPNSQLGKDLVQYEIAKMKKEGVMQLQPGAMSVDLATGERTFAPKVAEGITINKDGVAEPVLGYGDAVAGIAGKTKRAEAAGSAAYDMVTVNTPNGPVMMTREQAVQMSGGGTPSSTVNFTGSNGTKMNFEGLSPQQVYDRVRAINDPKLTQTFNEWAQSGGRPGIPLQSEAQQAYQKELAKQQADATFNQPQATFAVKSAIGTMDSALTQIANLRKSPGLSNITGPVMGRLPNVTGEATNAQANLDTLKSQVGVHVLTAMRQASQTGGAVGNVTEKEWPILQNQLGALQQAQTTEQFVKGLTDVEATLNRVRKSYVEQYETRYGQRDDLQPPKPSTDAPLSAAEQAELQHLREKHGRKK